MSDQDIIMTIIDLELNSMGQLYNPNIATLPSLRTCSIVHANLVIIWLTGGSDNFRIFDLLDVNSLDQLIGHSLLPFKYT